eukprot:ANDGO_07007.mRNA.1 Dynein light chain Tctex-type
MDSDEAVERVVFRPEEVSELVTECIESTIKTAVYNTSKVDQWTSSIIEACLKKLSSLNIPFKYIVTCIVMQRTGAGIHSACAAFWDTQSDAVCNVKWENDSMQCIVSVYGLAI